MKPVTLLVPCLLSVALLAACGKSEGPSTVSTAPSAAAPASDAPTAPERREAKPLAAYALIDLSPNLYPQNVYLSLMQQARAAYWSGMDKDLAQLAYDYSEAYRAESDSFKRADLLKTQSAQLEQAYAQAQQQHDYAVRTSSIMQIYPYDATLKGFKLAFSSDDERTQIGVFKNAGQPHNQGAWNFRFVGIPVPGPNQSFIYHPRDEDEARAIEAVLAPQRRDGGDSVNVFAQYEGHVLGGIHSPNNDDVALFGVDAITAVDRKSGKPLLTLGGQALGPIEVKCDSTRKALKLAEPAATGGWAMAASSAPSC